MAKEQLKEIPLFTVFMSADVDKPLLDVLHSGYIGQGPKVDELEKYLANLFGFKNILTLNSGTSALHLALRLAGVKPGDEVISTPMTCTATNMPILANGGKIVWADVDPHSGLIDPLDVERKITKKTKAIMCVDWGGLPCHLDELMRIGSKYGLKVIEDSAHALGATYKGRKVGTVADFTCFSLQAIKHITSVDGGLLFMKDTQDYKNGKLLRWYGIDRESDRKDFRCEENILDWGYKFHMNDINATIALHQFPHLDRIIGAHRANADFFHKQLPDEFDWQTVSYHCESSYWLFTIMLKNKETRLNYMKFMKSQGISVSQVHSRNDTHTVFKDSQCILPGVEEFYDCMVCIPVHSGLTQYDLNRIVNASQDFVKVK